ncbi:MAG: replication initiator protein A [Syntrophotalea acetylenica]|nr:replication initiator protein A [Syntrophotalea acetylenica]
MTVRQGNAPAPVSDALDATLERLRKEHVEKSQRIEAQALPGETFDQTAERLHQESKASRSPASSIRKTPAGDDQLDLFVPMLYDVGTKDSRSIMDVAPFRLSKRDKRAGEVLRYELADGYVEVKAGPDGMASVWDYDIILMCISLLTEAVNRWKAGQGKKPINILRPHISEILKFCRKGDGGNQAEQIESALDRLKNTTIKIVRQRTGRGGKTVREVEAEGLLNKYKVLSFTEKGNLAEVEIEIPGWIYREVVEAEKPGVLTVHPDYFLIDSGLGRFLYRIARKAAGRSSARWLFSTLYERSGSTGKLNKFNFNLRKLIEANDLPEYHLSECESQDGRPMLVMTYRDAKVIPMCS